MSRCMDCEFYKKNEQECHKNAPVAVVATDPPTKTGQKRYVCWPIVGAEDFCGEFKATGKDAKAAKGKRGKKAAAEEGAQPEA